MVGPQAHLRAVCIGPEDDIERRQREIAAAAKSVDMGKGVIVATDMFGGTPCNLALTLLERGKIEVLAGVNLPSLIKLVDVRTPIAARTGSEGSHRCGAQIHARGDRWISSAERHERRRKHCAVAKIVNKRGLHARASAKIVEASARFQSHVTVSKDGQTVDGRSIMGLMMLAASFGRRSRDLRRRSGFQLRALKAMLALAEAKFGEE